MKAVILAGGLGTRLAEETGVRPKPMVEIGGKPILWHIMKIYSAHGVHDFVVCCGYKGYMIKEYFANYFLHMSDVTFDMQARATTIHHAHAEPWKVTLVDTGEATQTGGRLRRVREYLDDGDFCMTYGDGLGNVDITASIAFHRRHGRQATMTAARPPARFGAFALSGTRVTEFREKPPGGDDALVNGGFFVLSPRALDVIEGDATIWEREPLERLAAADQLQAWIHEGFWQPMDTMRDRQRLEELWQGGSAPWKAW